MLRFAGVFVLLLSFCLPCRAETFAEIAAIFAVMVVPIFSPSTMAAAISKGIHPCVHIINVMATVALDD